MITPSTLTEQDILDACRDLAVSFTDAWDALGDVSDPKRDAARARICEAINARGGKP